MRIDLPSEVPGFSKRKLQDFYIALGAVYDRARSVHWVYSTNRKAMKFLNRDPEFQQIKIDQIVEQITLRPFQIKGVENILRYQRFALFYETGAGKTITALEAFAQVKRLKPESKCLFATVKGVFDPDIHDLAGLYRKGRSVFPGLKFAVISNVKKETYYKAKAEEYGFKHQNIENTEIELIRRCDVLITNHDLVKRYPAAGWAEHFNFLILDESEVVSGGQKTKKVEGKNIKINSNFAWFEEFADHCEYIALLSGTPYGEKGLELWAQFRLVDPGLLGVNKWNFCRRFAHKDRFGHWEFSKEEDQKVAAAVSELSQVVTRTIALPFLPRRVMKYLNLETSKEAKLTAEVFADIMTDEEKIGAAMGYSQLASGFKYLGDRVHYFSHHKQNALKQYLNRMIQDKWLIWYQFSGELEEIISVLPEGSYVIGNSEHNAGKSKLEFINNPEIKFFVVQHRSLSRGADGIQSVCSRMLFWSPPYGIKTFEQMIGRAERSGQDNSVLVLCFRTLETIEEHIYRLLEEKKDKIGAINDTISTGSVYDRALN